MKILYFHQHFCTPKGPGGTRSYKLARALIDDGHEVTMVCGSLADGVTGLEAPFVDGMRRGLVDGIDIVEFDLSYSNNDNFLKRTRTFLSFALRSCRLAMTESFDLLFATTTPLTAGIPGILARWTRRKPFVFEVRDLWPELPRAMGVIRNPVVLGAMSVLEWLCYRSADRLIGLSPGIVDGIAARGVSRDRITFIPNGCDLDIFDDEAPAWRPDGVGENDLLAVFPGAHGIANGLDAVLDAAAELKTRGRDDIKMALVGSGALKADLQRRAQKEGLDNVVFHDPVPKRKVAGLLASADLGMQILADVPAFYYGTSPNKFFDYIAAGLPVLNNYPGWLAGLIGDHLCGFAVPPRDPKAFADALEQAAADRDALRQMGANARKLARSQFDRKHLATDFVGVLTKAAPEKGRGRLADRATPAQT